MTPLVRILVGDARKRLAEIPDQSIQCVVTSPPYFGLRDYGTAEWLGGDEQCQHRSGNQVPDGKAGRSIAAGVRPGMDASQCRACGAVRQDRQIGLEPTPAEYVAALVALMREIARVLKPDGVLWLNLGDSYCASAKGSDQSQDKSGLTSTRTQQRGSPTGVDKSKLPGLKPKDLIGIPWMVAFALRAEGWYLRRDIIWSKPNTMPESVDDRCTSSHEYLFMLTRSPRYYYDADAIAEPASYVGQAGQDASGFKSADLYGGRHAATDRNVREPRRPGRKQQDRQRGHGRRHEGFNERWDQMSRAEQCSGTRNKRSVWTVAPKPFELEMCGACKTIYTPPFYRRLKRRREILEGGKEKLWIECSQCGSETDWVSHFATFPPELIVDCIKATSREGDLVLDPFGGAGTTALVADRLRRNAILLELNPDYARLAEFRITHEAGIFGDVRVE